MRVKFGATYQWRGLSGRWRGLILVRLGDADEWAYLEPGDVSGVGQWLFERGERVPSLPRLERAVERAAGVRRRRRASAARPQRGSTRGVPPMPS